jgi:peptide/nickel transport system permease protein
MTGLLPSEAVASAGLAGGPAGTPRPRAFGWIPQRWRVTNVELAVGGAIVGVILFLVIFAPLFTSFDPTDQDLVNALAAPGGAHLLGTDNLGRDVWSRLLYGGRSDLFIATIAVVVPLVFGTIVGAICGYFGGWFDMLVMRIGDIVAAFPFYVLVIALVFVLGSGATSVFVAISVVSWVSYARIVRAETMIVRDREFIDACKTAGFNKGRIVLRHIIPNTATQAVVYAMSDIVLNISVIVTLSFFGLGIVPPTPDWGQMMSDGRQFMASGRYELILIPGAAVVLTSLGLSFLGDGIANVLRAKQ